MGKAWSSPHAAGVALVLAVLLALLAAACGAAGSDDPFAGTWRDAEGRTVAIIAPRDDGYRVTLYRWTLQNAERSGDRLRAWTELRTSDGELSGRRLEAVFTRDPTSGGLVYTDPGGPGLRMELVRASNATDLPSPWPTGGAQ